MGQGCPRDDNRKLGSDRTYETSYQTTLPSFKSFAFTIPEKSLTKVGTDGQTYGHE